MKSASILKTSSNSYIPDWTMTVPGSGVTFVIIHTGLAASRSSTRFWYKPIVVAKNWGR
jgi:hypothetical protein